MRVQGKLQRKHVMARYGISRKHLDKAIREGELEFNSHGWANTADVDAWAAKHGHARLDRAASPEALANLRPQGGGLVPDDYLSSLQSIYIPQEILQNAADALNANKALIGTIQAQERQLKMFKDSGRLADLRELQAIMDSLINLLVTAATGLPVELAEESARRHKIKVGPARKVLEDAAGHLLKVLEAARADLEKQVQAFQDAKGAEVKVRVRNG